MRVRLIARLCAPPFMAHYQGLERIARISPVFSKGWKPARLTFPILGKTRGSPFQSLEKLALGFALLAGAACAGERVDFS